MLQSCTVIVFLSLDSRQYCILLLLIRNAIYLNYCILLVTIGQFAPNHALFHLLCLLSNMINLLSIIKFDRKFDIFRRMD